MKNLRIRIATAVVLVCGVSGVAQQSTNLSENSIRGWLSDEQCARGRAEGGAYTATNPRCAKECVAKGKKVVLIDPERKQIFTVTNQSLAKKNVGDYVEIVGQTDLGAKTIRISSLKMLERGTASCSRPQLKN
jgi:hypothetical protein